MHGEYYRCVETDERDSFLLDAPQGLNATLLPIYSGKLIVKASNGDVLEVPYQGVGFALSEDLENMSVGTYPWLRAGFPPKDTTT